jgi:hypothetical protein
MDAPKVGRDEGGAANRYGGWGMARPIGAESLLPIRFC